VSDEAFDIQAFPGPEEHGPTQFPDAPQRRRTISSAVWGSFPVRVTSEHAQDVTEWNPSCSWYQYGKELCLNGCQHPGMDIALNRGTQLFAAEGGVVAFAGKADVFRPHFVLIRTDSGSEHIYAHLWSVDGDVVKHARVETGQFLGTSGEQTVRGTMTPDGSGPHLHFEVRKGGCAIDPEPILVGAPDTGPIGPAGAHRPGAVLRVAQGPLNLRAGAGVDAELLGSLEAGTRVVVLEGPSAAGDHDWYDIQVIGGTGRGWVAGTFCEAIDI
jgi:hypothetical protein